MPFVQVKKAWLETNQMSYNSTWINKCDVVIKMEY